MPSPAASCAADAATALQVARHGVRRHAVRRQRRRRRVPAHHDRRRDAGRAGHRGAARAVPRRWRAGARSSPACMRAGDNRRRRGEDLAAGKPALRAGRVLKAGRHGAGRVAGHRRGRRCCAACAWRCSRPATSCARSGQPLAPGCVYDSNRYSLLGALQRLGVEVDRPRPRRRRPGGAAGHAAAAVQQADVVLTSGGVSMGDADHTRDVLAQHGRGRVLEGGDAAGPAVRLRPAAAARRRASRRAGCSRCPATRSPRWSPSTPSAATRCCSCRAPRRSRCRCCRRAARRRSASGPAAPNSSARSSSPAPTAGRCG